MGKTVYCLKQHGTVVRKGPFKLIWQFTLAKCGGGMDQATFSARGYCIAPAQAKGGNDAKST